MAKKTYVVKDSDNLASLSKALGISIQEIQKANGIRNLTPGQTIKIPSTGSAGQQMSGSGAFNSLSLAQQRALGVGAPNQNFQESAIAPKKSTTRFGEFVNALLGRNGNDAAPYMAAAGGTTVGLPGNRTSITGTHGAGFQAASQYNGPAFAPSGFTNTPVEPRLNNPLYNTGGGRAIPSPAQNRFIGAQAGAGGFNPATVPFFNNQQLGLPAPQFSYAPQGQSNSYTPYPPATPRQFSYSPQGQQLPSYAPINPATYLKPAPFLTTANLATPTYGNQQQGQYGNYAPGNKLYSGQPKTAQESFQQGNRNIYKRGWIGRGRNGGADDGGIDYATQQQQEMANAIRLNPGDVRKMNWRI